MNRPGFALVQRQGTLTLEVYAGRQSDAGATFTSYHRSPAGLAVVLGRLYYRRDLLDRLGGARGSGLPQAPTAALDNARLVMAAYECWGRDGFSVLEGDFAAALYDARERRLIGVRDTLGGYPLYYVAGQSVTAFATCLGPLTHLLPSTRVSTTALADYLLLRGFGYQQPDRDASIIEGVGRVRIGQCVDLELGSGAAHSSVYWTWAGTIANCEVAERDPGEIEERFAGLLGDAVRERCTGTTAAQLSGGMDSTAVALLAAERMSRPLHTVSLVYERWSGLAQETRFLHEALQASPALVPQLLRADDIHDFSRFATPPPTDEPWPGLYRVGTEAAMYDAAAAVGATSMLTGAGGDEVVDALPFDVADRLRAGKPRSAWRLATQWAAGQNRNVWGVFGPYGVLPLVPAPLRGGLGTVLRRGRATWRKLDDTWIPPWIRTDFAHEHGLYDRAIRSLRQAQALDRSLQVSESLHMITARSGDMIRWYLGAPRGIHTGNPFLDPRVFRYGLAARGRLSFQPERQKPLLADAMRGVVPDAIRNRRRKGNFNEAYFIGLSRHADQLEAMIESAPVDDLGFLDKAVLTRCFREYRMARASNQRAFGRMTIILSILNWLSHYRSWINAIPPE